MDEPRYALYVTDECLLPVNKAYWLYKHASFILCEYPCGENLRNKTGRLKGMSIGKEGCFVLFLSKGIFQQITKYSYTEPPHCLWVWSLEACPQSANEDQLSSHSVISLIKGKQELDWYFVQIFT